MKLQKVFVISILTSLAFLFMLNARVYAYSQQDSNTPVPAAKQQKKGFSVNCKLSYIVSIPGKTTWVRLTALIPESLPNIQKIDRLEYSITPVRFFTRNGFRYAEFMIYNPGRIEKLDITFSAELFKYDLETAMTDKTKNRLQETGLDEFLREEKYIEKNSTEIRAVANSIKGASEIELVRNIYSYIIDNMEYLLQGKRDRGAAYALKYRKGDCSEYADLFVALCRAKKIPARVVTGISVQADTKTAKHNWAEVYLKNFGWVPFDPSKGDIRYTALKDRLFSNLDPKYIYFSHLRNDAVLQNYHFCSFTYFGDQIRVSDSISFEFPKKSN